MKYLLLFGLLFLSCEKDSGCYKCTITTTTSGTSYASGSQITTIEKCDMSEKDVKTFISASTSSAKSGNITVTSTANCIRK